jgi:hypothetical protein
VVPNDLPIGIAIKRATMSVGPPAAKGTTSETGLLFGQFVCAVATLLPIKALALTMAANPANTVFFNFIGISIFYAL